MIRPILLTMLLACPATAQEALYGAQPPLGSAYVRFVNATAAPHTIQPNFLPLQVLGTAIADRVTPYAVVEHVAGRPLQVHAGAADIAVTVVADRYVTILLTESQAGATSLAVINESAEFNQARARLSFYNAMPNCGDATLTLDAAGTNVFAGVAYTAAQSRAVHPVAASLRAKCGSAAPATAQLEGMEAGRSYSIWLMPGLAGPVAFVTRDTTLAYRR